MTNDEFGRWLGDAPQAGPGEFAQSGAQVVFVRRGTPALAELTADRSWREWNAVTEKSSLIGELMTGQVLLPAAGVNIRVFVRTSQ